MITRPKLIQLVHVGAHKLFGKNEEARRAWQQAKTGHDSCSRMHINQLEDLVADLRRQGALDKRPPRRAGRKPFNRSLYMDKIEAQLAEMGLSWQYAESIAWRITGGRGIKPESRPGVKRLEWVRDPAHFKGVIAALDAEQRKRGIMASINQMLPQLGMSFTDVDALVRPGLRGTKWQRHLPTLEALAKYLAERIDSQQAEDSACP